jgi:hypothetical protein
MMTDAARALIGEYADHDYAPAKWDALKLAA